MSSLLLLLIGFGIFFFAWKAQDEINRITAMFSGTISLIWGLALAPLPLQLFFEIVSLIAAFSFCMRCLGCGSNRN